jgi:hypothetical protein
MRDRRSAESAAEFGRPLTTWLGMTMRDWRSGSAAVHQRPLVLGHGQEDRTSGSKQLLLLGLGLRLLELVDRQVREAVVAPGSAFAALCAERGVDGSVGPESHKCSKQKACC